jgi:cation:H+ antiporter
MDATVAGMLVGGIILLVVGAEALVRGASRLASAMGVTPLAIGLTVVAFGTSAPELAVSVQGAVSGAGDVAVGNVVGSNIFNLLAILGLAAACSALVVHRRVVRLDLPILLGATLLVSVLAWNGTLGRIEGAVLTATLLTYTTWVYRASRRENHATQPSSQAPTRRWPTAAAAIVVGLAALVAGAQLLVTAATSIAVAAGVTELAIGLTVVAAGTSLPELATSVAAAVRGQRDIAVGNIVGSNLFNLLGVLGASALLAPNGLPVIDQVRQVDLPLSLLVTLVVLPCLATGLIIRRWEGTLLIVAYGGYLTVALLAGTNHPRAGSATTALVVGLAFLAVTITAVGWVHRHGRFVCA